MQLVEVTSFQIAGEHAGSEIAVCALLRAKGVRDVYASHVSFNDSLPEIPALVLQLFDNFGGYRAGFIQRTGLQADGAYARMTASAVTLTDASQIVLGYFPYPRIRSDRNL